MAREIKAPHGAERQEGFFALMRPIAGLRLLITNVMTRWIEAVFERGTSNPCMFLRHQLDDRVLVHSDYFTVSGNKVDLRWVRDILMNKFQTKVRGVMRPYVLRFESMTI